MRKFLRKINHRWKILRYLPWSILFCVRYLPLRQALKVPILFYKPQFSKLQGNVKIDCTKICFGMIRLGFPEVSLYPNLGFVWEVKDGCVLFRGKCEIGNDSFISVGSGGLLDIGDDFKATAALKIACHYRVVIKERVLCGWETVITDSDFHKLSYVDGSSSVPFGPVLINSNCWLAMKVIVLKGCVLPVDTVVAANSVCNRDYSDVPQRSLLAGIPAKCKKQGVFLDRENLS